MAVAVVTGAAGLIGSEACEYFANLGLHVVGIDNDMRGVLFGEEASTSWNARRLQTNLGSAYTHLEEDIRDRETILETFEHYGRSIVLVIHAAAQPSHDWAAKDPFTDFDINAVGTLNLLEATRRHSPEAVFIFTSTNKVYGDLPNDLPLQELQTRFEIAPDHPYAGGISENMPIDDCLHSLFGASKVAADVLVQEYGRYFSMKTACFRGGTLTGPRHSATELHGFLAYVMRCAVSRTTYTIFGYRGKQVRDAIHSHDLIRAFDAVFQAPRVAEIYNIGGGRFSNCSVLEAIELAETISGQEIQQRYENRNRIGDHIWWIGDNSRFSSHYPDWELRYNVERILRETYEMNAEHWKQ